MDLVTEPLKNAKATQRLLSTDPERLRTIVSHKQKRVQKVFAEISREKMAAWLFDAASDFRISPEHNCQLKDLANIPFTDLLLYLKFRLSETDDGSIISHQVSRLTYELARSHNISLQPSILMMAENPDGGFHCPTFGELVLAFPNMGYCDANLPELTRPTSVRDAVHQLALHHIKNLENNSFKTDNFYLASAIFNAQPNGHNLKDYPQFSESTRQNVIAKSIEQSIHLRQPKEQAAFIEHAFDNRIPLEELTVRGIMPLQKYLQQGRKSLALDVFDRLVNKQLTEQELSNNAHRIDHDFNPTAFFDF